MKKIKWGRAGCVLLFSALLALAFACQSPAASKKAEAIQNQQTEIEASVAREVKIGKKVAEEISKEMEIVNDPIETARVQMIFDKLAPRLDRPLPYNIHIVKDKKTNAFCIPGGNIYVTTGLIKFVHCDAELASVISHELIHANEKHVIIQMERNQKLSLAALAIAIASQGEAAAVMLGSVASMAMSSSYSRDLEQQADLKGIKLLVSAGYPATAALTVMEGLAEEELKLPWFDPGVAADHPSIAERISYIREQIRKMGLPLHRKEVLGVMRTSVAASAGTVTLSIDGLQFLTLSDTQDHRSYLAKVAGRIDKFLQMELSPYDIKINKMSGGVDGLFIGIAEILRTPLPDGTKDLESLRGKLLVAQGNALKKHPVTDYLR